MTQDDCKDANQALKDNPVGGYCFINVWPRSPDRLEVCLDGDFDLEDLKRVVGYMETILEDSHK